jgi:phosphoribosyl 1,2-cyclic phosphodiesterase
VTTLYVLGSGSGGNALAVVSDGEALLIDAGFSAREITRRAEHVNLDLDRVTGLVLTHEHSDHTAGAARIARTLGIPVLCSPGTWDRLRRRMPTAEFRALALMGGVRHGTFHIEACPTSHDAAEPVSISVRSASGHRIGVAYDLGRPTAGVRFLLRESHAIVLEANHDEILLRLSDYPPAVRQRIASSGGHLSNRAAADLLEEVTHPGLRAVVLAHLSERCNSVAQARAVVEPVLARHGVTFHVAKQDQPMAPIELGGR